MSGGCHVVLGRFVGVIFLQESEVPYTISPSLRLAIPALLPRTIPEHWTVLREGISIYHQHAFLSTTRYSNHCNISSI